MFECLTEFVLGEHMGGRTFDPPIGPMGQPRLLAQNRKPYATRDGYLCLLLYNDKQWRAFLRLIGQEEAFERDPRFASQESRSKHFDAAYAFVAEHLRTRTSAEWLDLLVEADVPVMPLNSLEDLLEDEHLNETGFFRRVEHPTEGTITSMTVPSRWSESTPELRSPAPLLGEHSVEILREAGYSDAEIDTLLQARVTAKP